jgi:hypothetical protein
MVGEKACFFCDLQKDTPRILAIGITISLYTLSPPQAYVKARPIPLSAPKVFLNDAQKVLQNAPKHLPDALKNTSKSGA